VFAIEAPTEEVFASVTNSVQLRTIDLSGIITSKPTRAKTQKATQTTESIKTNRFKIDSVFE